MTRISWRIKKPDIWFGENSPSRQAGLICQDDLCLCPKASASRRLTGANDELGTRAFQTQACQMHGRVGVCVLRLGGLGENWEGEIKA